MTIGLFLKKKKIREYIDKYNMIERGDGVVIGLSGGPDSVCLFFVLLALKSEYNLTLRAVHINHMIRGEDADEDEEYVRRLCSEFQVPLEVKRVDIPKLAAASGRSIEEEARLARYEAFEEAANLFEEEGMSSKIAVAHNADDNAETVLFHMARGAGLDGMCGIAPVRGIVIRPLLEVSKKDILSFLGENEVAYCVDITNSQVDYDRNRIRHNIMPELTQINDKALEHISEMTARLSDIADYLSLEANGLLQMAKLEDNKLRKRTIATAPRVVASQALKEYLSRFMPQQKDVGAYHIDSILDLLNEDGERQIQLPYNKTIVISYEEIYVIDKDAKKNNPVFNYREFEYKEGMAYPSETYTKW
ncbi:MAG: tRNA lysidine(34) synthetase TilS, partial [Pseudobutyrivibrio sp.]|nr:tRNA lysidine(34) synthetase TilS [Pseudobutyrivibrio sp.]